MDISKFRVILILPIIGWIVYFGFKLMVAQLIGWVYLIKDIKDYLKYKKQEKNRY